MEMTRASSKMVVLSAKVMVMILVMTSTISAKELLSTKECEDLGFTGLALCSDCHSLSEYVKDQGWAPLSSAVVNDAKNMVSKNTEDQEGQKALMNVFRAAEAVEVFGGILTSLKMEIDDSIGMSGENVTTLPEDITKALCLAYQRYTIYLDAFRPEEVDLKKKVEMELGTKMIHLKMRCSGLGSEWGKVTVLGTSGLSGSYMEQRA